MGGRGVIKKRRIRTELLLVVKKNDLRKLAADPRFIPGIYNYCDRWCERCPLSHRCLTYAVEQADDDPAGRNVHNEAFWKKLQGIFDQTREMLEEMAAERCIELDAALPDVEPAADGRHRSRAAAWQHRVADAAQTYMKMVDGWFEGEKALFQDRGRELDTLVQLGLSGVEEQAYRLKDLVDVIRWYQPFIFVKLRRAVSSSVEEAADRSASSCDADGSAKIALIAADRSISAWAEMRSQFPERTDSILDLLLALDRLRRDVEQAFPYARQFVRPGFDPSPGETPGAAGVAPEVGPSRQGSDREG